MWETFKGRNRRLPGELAVTLTKMGNIGLNTAIIGKLEAKERFAVLMFDKEKSLIGIKVMKAGSPDSYPIKLAARDNYAQISGTAFLKSYGIFPPATQNFAATIDERNRIIVVDVSGLAGRKAAKKEK